MAACAYPMYLPKREIYVPCGTCGYCLKNRKEEWTFRLKVELDHSQTAHFVTLTYADEYVPIQYGTGIEILDKEDLQDFLKRLRYYHSLHSKTQVRYYAVGEYGSQFLRPHYHLILFNCTKKDVDKAWPLGFTKFEPVNMASIGYVLGYVSSIDDLSVSRGVPKQFCLMSKRPAIGYQYVRQYYQWHQDNLRNYTSTLGKKGRLPRFYKKVMFNDDQKKLLSEKALESYESKFAATIAYYKTLGHSDPYYSADQLIKHNERQIIKAIKETKKSV